MKVRQRRPKDAGSIVVRKRADGSEAFMLKYRGYTRTHRRSVETRRPRPASGLRGRSADG